jgi:hypothetical protein
MVELTIADQYPQTAGYEIRAGLGRKAFDHPCAYRKSNPDILVVQSAQDRTADNAFDRLGGP